MFVHLYTDQNTFNFNDSSYARKALPIQGQQRHWLVIVWKHASLFSLGEGAFHCLLWSALVIKQWLTDDVTDRILVWEFFVGFSKHPEEKCQKNYYKIYVIYLHNSSCHINDDQGITNQHKSILFALHRPFNPLSTRPSTLQWLTTHLHAYGHERVNISAKYRQRVHHLLCTLHNKLLQHEKEHV